MLAGKDNTGRMKGMPNLKLYMRNSGYPVLALVHRIRCGRIIRAYVENRRLQDSG